MGRNEFIKIGDTRIKLSNIKHYGISEKRKVVDCIVGEYRRTIWFSDFAKKSYHPIWDDMTQSEKYDLFRFDGRFKEFEDIDDSCMWKNYIDIDALKIEYEKVKAVAVQMGEKEKQSNKERNKFTGFFKNVFGSFGKIDEERSEQEVTVSFYRDDDFLSDTTDIVVDGIGYNRRVIFTKGKLYFNGEILRCDGSPFKGARIVKETKQEVEGDDRYSDSERKQICSQDRIYAEEAELINSGELTKIYYDVAKDNPEVVVRRYLEITTYQNEKFTFEQDECNIDNILKKLDDNFTL